MKSFFKVLVGVVLLSVVSFAKMLGIVMPNATHGFTGESIKHAKAAAEEYAKKEDLNINSLLQQKHLNKITSLIH